MKKRLDLLLVEKGLVSGRDKAKSVIMAGQVYVDNQKAEKPGTEISPDSHIELRGSMIPFVSRGGLKLEKAIERFQLNLTGKICGDIGASTGGFTDCMLQNGASRVYAVDVGYGQLAWKLRNDPRVVNLERTNIRYITEEQIPEPLEFASIDVSFISLELVLPVVCGLLRDGGEIVCLIKPQFEAGREKVGKKGVVREPETHIEVIDKVWRNVNKLKMTVKGIGFSPIKGPQGNIEYLMLIEKAHTFQAVDEQEIRNTVETAHGLLG